MESVSKIFPAIEISRQQNFMFTKLSIKFNDFFQKILKKLRKLLFFDIKNCFSCCFCDWFLLCFYRGFWGVSAGVSAGAGPNFLVRLLVFLAHVIIFSQIPLILSWRFRGSFQTEQTKQVRKKIYLRRFNFRLIHS